MQMKAEIDLLLIMLFETDTFYLHEKYDEVASLQIYGD